MAMPVLTPNAIASIAAGNLDLRPLLQVLDVKEMAAPTKTYYRLLLSDGALVQQSVLATQLSGHISSGQIKKGTIVQLLDYVCNTVRDLRIIQVLNLEIISFSSDTIGSPKQFLQKQQAAQQSPNAETVSGFQKETGIDNSSRLGQVPQAGVSSGDSPHGRAAVSSVYEPAPTYSNKGPIARNQAPAKIIPIAALNPYQGRWTIRARVTAKGDLRRFHNARGDGKVFHFDLLDADGGEIRVTCFNNAADKFFNEIDVGKVYLISKGSLKPAQRNFNHLKNDWEIFLENSSTVELCREDEDNIPQQQFKFVPITEVENMEENMMVDVIGVVVTVSPTSPILRKNGLETQKRTLELRDMSGRSVELTMWGSFCAREGNLLKEKCDSGHYPVLAVKAGRISDFSGKSVGTISTTQLMINPCLPEAQQLRNWFENVGKDSSYHSISRDGGPGARIEMRKTVTQIRDEGLGRSDKPDWIAVKGTVSYIKTDTFCYTACPLMVGERQCNRKVLRSGDGMWWCDRCDKSVPECEYRYLLSMQIQDHTGVTWVTAFQEAGEEVLGVRAKELYLWKQDEDPRFEDTLQKIMFTQSLFKLKVKEENYQHDELRVKCTVIKTEKLDFVAESRVLLDLIGKLMRGEDMNGSNPNTSLSSGQSGRSEYQYGSTSMGYNVASLSTIGSGYASNKVYGSNSSSAFTGGGSSTVGNSCYKCGQAGHWAKDCLNKGRERF